MPRPKPAAVTHNICDTSQNVTDHFGAVTVHMAPLSVIKLKVARYQTFARGQLQRQTEYMSRLQLEVTDYIFHKHMIFFLLNLKGYKHIKNVKKFTTT